MVGGGGNIEEGGNSASNVGTGFPDLAVSKMTILLS